MGSDRDDIRRLLDGYAEPGRARRLEATEQRPSRRRRLLERLWPWRRRR